MATVTKSVAKLERLLSVYDAYLRAERADEALVAKGASHSEQIESARRCIRAQSELIDACVDCGMAIDASEFEFASRVTTQFLCKAA